MKFDFYHYKASIVEATRQTSFRNFTKYPYLSYCKGLVSVSENELGGFSCSLIGYLPFSCSMNHLFVPIASEIEDGILYCDLAMTFRNIDYSKYVKRIFGTSINHLEKIEMDIMKNYFKNKI